MRILVVEDEIGASIDSTIELVERGHDVVRCQPLARTVWPCTGLAGGPCPLTGEVDAVLVVRSPGVAASYVRTLGAFCGESRQIPVVTVDPRERAVAGALVEAAVSRSG